MLGVDPDPLTLRELFWRYHGKMRATWSQTASICAVIANVNRGKRTAPISPYAFTPYRPRAGERISFKAMLKRFKDLEQPTKRRRKRKKE